MIHRERAYVSSMLGMGIPGGIEDGGSMLISFFF